MKGGGKAVRERAKGLRLYASRGNGYDIFMAIRSYPRQSVLATINVNAPPLIGQIRSQMSYGSFETAIIARITARSNYGDSPFIQLRSRILRDEAGDCARSGQHLPTALRLGRQRWHACAKQNSGYT